MRNKEIAADLGIRTDTASAHVKSVVQKFGVHDRTALAEAVRRGIIRIRARAPASRGYRETVLTLAGQPTKKFLARDR